MNVLRLSLVLIGVIALAVFIIRAAINASIDKTSYASTYMRILMNHLHMLLITAYFHFNWSYHIKKFYTTIKPIAQATSFGFSFDCLYNDIEHGYLGDDEMFRLFF